MFVTVRQLEDLHRRNGSNGHVTLPYRARLTPLAQDWVKSKRLVLGYSDAEAPAPQTASAGASPSAAQQPSSGSIVWWCDGPCGPAKAALAAYEKESPLRPLDMPHEPRATAAVIKAIATKVKIERVEGAVLMVQTGAAALVFANRCSSLRAILGTCLDAVDQGLQQVAANVLVIEHRHQTLQQMKNMLGRFLKPRREPGEDVRRQLQELASCG